MHSPGKGQSGSKKPLKKVPSWAPYKESEVEKLVIKYAKAGKTASEIGLVLRDAYGINSVKALTGKSITALLEENKLSKKLPEDMMSLIKKLIDIKAHLEKNKHDETAGRGLILTVSKLNRLIKYYRKTQRIAADWKLDQDRLKMYLE
jgi:small subunit ribosomal protein S15